MTIYRTQEYSGYGKQNYYWNEYPLADGCVVQYRCRRWKHFDGHESEWEESEKATQEWTLDDPNMPEGLRRYL